MSERRSSPRKRSFLQGRLLFNGRQSAIDCVVRDLSDDGARVAFSAAVAIPDIVELVLPSKEETFRARVAWRRGEEAGLAFLHASNAVADDDSSADLGERVRKLESEVASLRRLVMELRTGLRQRSTGEF